MDQQLKLRKISVSSYKIPTLMDQEMEDFKKTLAIAYNPTNNVWAPPYTLSCNQK